MTISEKIMNLPTLVEEDSYAAQCDMRNRAAQEATHHLNNLLVEAISFLASCKRKNTDEWMMGMMDRLNSLLDNTLETDRIIYDTRDGTFKILDTTR